MYSFVLSLILFACVTSEPTLHIVGDSQACSVKPHAPKDAVVTCKVGSRTAEWVQRIDTAGIKPGDDVLVFLGSNDWGGHPDAKPLLAKLRGTRCVFVGPPLIRGKAGAADVLKAQVEADGTCAYLDSRELHLQQPDGVHTSEPARWLRAGVARLTHRGS